MTEDEVKVGDLVAYVWSKDQCGLVLEVGNYYGGQIGLHVLWTKGPTPTKNRWWVPLDQWIRKL